MPAICFVFLLFVIVNGALKQPEGVMADLVEDSGTSWTKPTISGLLLPWIEKKLDVLLSSGSVGYLGGGMMHYTSSRYQYLLYYLFL